MHKDLKELGIAIGAACAAVGAMKAWEGLRYQQTGNPLNEQEAQQWAFLQVFLAMAAFLVTAVARSKWT